MNLGHLLREADPLRDETVPAEARAELRQILAKYVASTAHPERERHILSRRRLMALAALAVVIIGSALWSRTSLQAAVRFEIRLAEDHPLPGVAPAYVTASGNTVYVYGDAVVTNDDIQSGTVVAGDVPGSFGVQVEFTPLGAQKMLQATGANVGHLMAILIDGEVVMAPIIRSPVTTIGLISGTYSYSEARHIVEGIRR
jgi:preprotein translocase subunit SecD